MASVRPVPAAAALFSKLTTDELFPVGRNRMYARVSRMIQGLTP
jgi:hypothetical protein